MDSGHETHCGKCGPCGCSQFCGDLPEADDRPFAVCAGLPDAGSASRGLATSFVSSARRPA